MTSRRHQWYLNVKQETEIRNKKEVVMLAGLLPHSKTNKNRRRGCENRCWEKCGNGSARPLSRFMADG